MGSSLQRHHWINTYVGILDAAFQLSETEQLEVIGILRQLLLGLRIPERTSSPSLPAPIALEVSSGFYTIQLAHSRDAGVVRAPRLTNNRDATVSPEAWRDAFTGMLFTAYPDLAPSERLLATKMFADLLAALGLPARAAAFLPETVVRAYHSSPEAQALYAGPGSN